MLTSNNTTGAPPFVPSNSKRSNVTTHIATRSALQPHLNVRGPVVPSIPTRLTPELGKRLLKNLRRCSARYFLAFSFLTTKSKHIDAISGFPTPSKLSKYRVLGSARHDPGPVALLIRTHWTIHTTCASSGGYLRSSHPCQRLKTPNRLLGRTAAHHESFGKPPSSYSSVHELG